MTKTDHLAKAKDYIAIAESDDAKIAAWQGAAHEIEAAITQDGYSQNAVAKELDRSNDWVRILRKWGRVDDPRHLPFGGAEQNEARYARQARTVLTDPERRKRALADLPASDLEDLIEESNEVAIDRVRAKRSEHETRPTTRELMGSDPFHPDEFWADNVIIRVNRNARELASLIKRGGGLILGAMEVERAFDYLNEAEQLIAEARAATQEQARDRVEVS